MVTSLITNTHPPQDQCRALGMVLLLGPRGGLFLMSEVPLYARVMNGVDRLDTAPWSGCALVTNLASLQVHQKWTFYTTSFQWTNQLQRYGVERA